MKVRDVMTRPVLSVRPDTAVREAITTLTDHGFASLPVVDDLGQVVGIVGEADFLRAGAGRSAVVASVMSTPVEVVHPGSDVAGAAETMLAHAVRCLPVVEEGLLVGVVSRRDLLRTLIRSDDVMAAKIRALLDDYAGSTRHWSLEVADGDVTVRGEFLDEAERRVVIALCRTVAGVGSVEAVVTGEPALAWDD